MTKTREERQIEKHFDKLVRKYRGVMRKSGGTSNHELDDIGRQVFKRRWVPTSTQMHLPIKHLRGEKRAYGIFNTDSYGPGDHWCAYVVNNNQFYIWDSFGRPAEEVVADLSKRLRNQRVRFRTNDLDRNQLDHQKDCGQRCLAWLECAKTLGIQKAM
jgi:hypothetical protein